MENGKRVLWESRKKEAIVFWWKCGCKEWHQWSLIISEDNEVYVNNCCHEVNNNNHNFMAREKCDHNNYGDNDDDDN